MDSPSPLSLEGLAEVLERHIEATSVRFRDVEVQIQALANRFEDVERQIQSLAGQVEGLLGLLRDQGLHLTALANQQAQQQVEIRQILHRLEQNDARWEQNAARGEQNAARGEQRDREIQEMLRRLGEHDGYIRRMLDLLERRGGDGGPGRA